MKNSEPKSADNLDIPAKPRRQRARPWSRTQARKHIAAYRASGLRMEDFARERGLSFYQVRNWTTRFRAEEVAQNAQPAPATVTLAEVKVRDDAVPASSWVEIYVGEVCVRVYPRSDEDAIVRAIQILKRGALSC